MLPSTPFTAFTKGFRGTLEEDFTGSVFID